MGNLSLTKIVFEIDVHSTRVRPYEFEKEKSEESSCSLIN